MASLLSRVQREKGTQIDPRCRELEHFSAKGPNQGTIL